MKKFVWVLILSPLLAHAQYCENFDTYSKTYLDSIGWDAAPNNGWSVNSHGAFMGRSCFLNAGASSSINLATECCSSSQLTDTLSLDYTFDYGTGVFYIGIQDGYADAGVGVIWLDTLEVVGTWTHYSLQYVPAFNPYKIVFQLTSGIASSKIGIDNMCLSGSEQLGICMVLPIELSSFTAEVIDGTAKSGIDVKLSWTTQSELNSKCFIIFRSLNELSFDSIGVTKATGNSISPITYSFIDHFMESGHAYYQLKMVDLDGGYTYSKIASVTIANGQPWVISNNILQNVTDKNIELIIYSSRGRVIYSGELAGFSRIDLRHLASGIYFVKEASSPMAGITIF